MFLIILYVVSRIQFVERIEWEGETTMRGLAVFVVVLSVCLAFSLLFSGYLYYKLNKSTEHHSTFFSFVFSPKMGYSSKMQNLTVGNLYLNLTFDVFEGNLTVKAEINADSYDEYAALALQFDSDNNGTIDPAYSFKDDLQFFLRPNNMTRPSQLPYWCWEPDGTIWACSSFSGDGIFERESPFHYCTFDEGKYTFYFTFPVNPTEFDFDIRGDGWVQATANSWMNGVHAIQGKLVRVLYGIVPWNGAPEDGMAVYVPPFKFME
jgi:hypothetical protein